MRRRAADAPSSHSSCRRPSPSCSRVPSEPRAVPRRRARASVTSAATGCTCGAHARAGARSPLRYCSRGLRSVRKRTERARGLQSESTVSRNFLPENRTAHPSCAIATADRSLPTMSGRQRVAACASRSLRRLTGAGSRTVGDARAATTAAGAHSPARACGSALLACVVACVCVLRRPCSPRRETYPRSRIGHRRLRCADAFLERFLNHERTVRSRRDTDTCALR